MSNISVTGNEAQFNEKVTFLKDVIIQGTVFVPQISGETTFLNRVNFSQDITFPEISVFNKFTVGAGGTLFFADTRLNDGRVGIGSSNPEALLDVYGKAKILDLDLRNLLVTGISTFQEDIFTGVGATIGISTDVFFKDDVNAVFGNDNDLYIFSHLGNSYVEGRSSNLNLRVNEGRQISLRAALGAFGEPDDEVLANFIPNSKVELFFDGNPKFETTGIGVSVLGDLIVPDVGIRTSRVGLGTTNPIGMHSVDDGNGILPSLGGTGNGALRLTVDGSISISRNIYDSAGSPGFNGYFLQRDGDGIRWSAFEPEETQGIRIQDEGVFIPNAGAAKTYSIVNFASVNSFGQGTDTIEAVDGVGAGLATVFTSDFWGFKTRNATDSSIYRMSKVGIGTTDPITVFQVNSNILGGVFAVTNEGKVGIGRTNPPAQLDVFGNTHLDDLFVTGISTFTGFTTFRNDVQFQGDNQTIFFDKSENTLEFPTETKLIFGPPGSLATMEIFYDEGNFITGTSSNDINIATDGTVNIRALSSTDPMIEAVSGGSVKLFYSTTETLRTLGTGITVFGNIQSQTLNVYQGSDLVGVTTQRSLLDATHLNVSGVSTFVGITTQQSSLFANRFIVAGLSTFSQDVDINASVDIEVDLTVNQLSTFNGNIDANANLDVDGQTDLDVLNVAETATFKDDVEFHGVSGITSIRFDKSDNSLEFVDNAKLKIGDDGDLEIYHTGSNTYISNSTGTLYTLTDTFEVKGSNGNETHLKTTDNGAVELYFNGEEKLRTTGIGISVLGITSTTHLNVTGVSTFEDDVKFTGQNYDVFWDKSENSLEFSDNAKIKFGEDLDIYSSGSDSYIISNQGDLFIQQTDSTKDINIQGANGTDSIVVDGAGTNNVQLFSSGNVKLTTNDDGIDVTGHVETDTLQVSGLSTFTGDVDANANVSIAGTATITQDLDVDGRSELDITNISETLNVVGVSTFQGTVDLDSTVKDQNDDIGTTVSSTLSNTITDATYNAANGLLQITIAGHGFSNGDSIQIPDNTLTFSCNYGNGGTQTYPRGKDPASGRWLVISNKTDDTFEVNVGDGGLASGNSHTFITASNGVYHSSGQYVKSDYRLASVGAGVSWRPSGVQTKRTIWVSKSGSDTNSGLLEGDAKATIGAAASIAVETDTIKIRPGLYIEDNPIGLRTDVSVTGEDLRLVTVQSKNKNKDVFHVRRGCLIENLNFGGSNVGVSHAGAACVAFPTPAGADSAVTGYTEPGPATAGPSGRWRSPYVRNCTNFMTDSIGLKVDGDNATASTIGGDLKSMVVDSYTQYNENGIGVSLTNNGYAQLVSIFTISCDIGIFATSGAQCDLTNSNSSFGNFGLVAVGLGSTQFTGIVSNTDPAGELIASTNAEGQDTVVCADVFDLNGVSRRPFDGQSLFFRIDLDKYPDVNTTGVTTGIDAEGRITAPLEQLESINLIATGNDLSGYSAIDPPSVLIRDADGEVEPKGPQGVIAEATANIDARGFLTGINVIAQGRNYLSGQNIIVDIEGNTGLATAVMSPIFFTVESATENYIASGTHNYVGGTSSNAVQSGGNYAHTFVSAVPNGVTSNVGNLPNAITNAVYTPNTGNLVITSSAHNLTASNTVTIADNALKFTCAMDNNATEHSYPRSTDPASGQTLAITNPTTNTFTVNVGASPIVNHDVTNASYENNTGVLVLTIGSNTLTQDTSIKIANGSLTFTCAKDNFSSQHSYPRPSDPFYDTAINIDSRTNNTITVNVGANREPAGITTITFNEFIPYELFPDDPFSLQRISRILTSSHSFEYVGAGTDINISTPLQGAIPIKANEIVAKDGAQIPFTSTDQQGNFDIGQGLQINQTTSSISGRDFSRSIQAQVTPLILALR